MRGADYAPAALRALLAGEADLARLDPESPSVSERRVMVRADRAALLGEVQQVMNACSEAGLCKLEIGAARID